VPKILGTCNPSKNWTYTEFYNPSLNGELRESRKFIQALPKDNPHLPQSYINTLLGLDPASKKRLHDGDQDFTGENTDIRMIEFFNINFIYPSGNKKYTIIGANGETLCCPKTVKEVSQLIKESKESK